MKIGLAAGKFINNNIDFNLKNCIGFIKQAKKHNVDLLLFGETYLQGFDALTWKVEEDLAIGIEKKSEVMDMLRSYCRDENIAVGMGYIERDGKKLFSSYIIIDKNGNELINYRRISKGWRTKNSDNQVYMEGTDFYVIDFMGHKMTVGLCGDFWTDEVIEKLPNCIDTVLWPVYVCWDKNQWLNSELNNYIEQSKKIGKNVFYINSICEEEESHAYGGAFAVINNELRALLDQGKEEILVVNY
jgi:N-carbamoylputrescine amidase